MYLLTRPIEESLATAEILISRNIKTHTEPMIVIQPKKEAIDEYNAAIKHADAIIVTSANALKVMQDGLNEQYNMPLYVVGKATEEKARSMGFKHVHFGGEDVNGLCAVLKIAFDSNQENVKLLYASGDVISHDVATSLQQHNIKVQRVVLYCAEQVNAFSKVTSELIKAGALQGVFFFSTRSAEIFLKLIKESEFEECLKGLSAYAMSNRVASKLTQLQWSNIRVAQRPTQEALLGLV